MSHSSAIPSNLIDVILDDFSGYSDQMKAEDTPDALWEASGTASRKFPQSLWIEPGPNFENWKDKARDNSKYHTWPINYTDRFTNQNPTHECTSHSHTRGKEACWNRQRGIIYPDGPKKEIRYPDSAEFQSVWFSCLSLYARANPRQWGGASIRAIMELDCRDGALPDLKQPNDYKFKHAMQGTAGKGNMNQSSGRFITESQFPEGWKETADNFITDEVIYADEWEQAMCLVLWGMFYHVGRNGHAIGWGEIDFDNEVLPYPDSYDVIRFDSFRLSKSAFRGGYAIASMRRPNNFANLLA